MLKIILLLLFLTCNCLTLHTHHSISLHSIADDHQASNLTGNQDFYNDFKAIQLQVSNVSNTMKSIDSTKYAFLITKTQEIQNSLDSLHSSLVKYNLTISQQSKTCPGVTTFNRTQIRHKISSIQQSQQSMQSYLSTCPDCSEITNSTHQIHNLTNGYISHLNKTLDGVFCTNKSSNQKISGIVNLNSSYFKNNLNAKNWYFGSTTLSDYKIYLFKRSATYNLTNCPIDNPFVNDDEQICFNCPTNGSIFNLGKQKCDTCKPDEILNLQSGSCVKCDGEKVFINGSLICKPCMISSGQLFNKSSGHCYKCTGNSYLDTQNLACIYINCSINTPRFNFSTKTCQRCGVSEIIDPNNITNCIKTNYIGVCPPITPYYDFNQRSCLSCPQNTTFNAQTNTCDKNILVKNVTTVSN